MKTSLLLVDTGVIYNTAHIASVILRLSCFLMWSAGYCAKGYHARVREGCRVHFRTTHSGALTQCLTFMSFRTQM